MISEILKKEISDVVSELGFGAVSVVLSHPNDLSHGDYAANIAMILAKKEGKNPVEVAGDIVAALKEKEIEFVSDIQIAGPGFINFTLAPEFFVKETENIVSAGEKYGVSEIHKGKKILVEHSSPNLFKPFHVGHVMNNAIGESIARLAVAGGADTKVMSFPSDISLGVAKAIFILLEEEGEDFAPSEISVLGDAYVKGTKRYEEDESVHARVKEIADNLYARNDSPELKVFDVCKKFNIEYFENITARLGSKFDSYIYESEAGVVGKDLVLKQENKKDPTRTGFREGEGGAIVYTSPEGNQLHTVVFINSQGNPTYESKDLGLLQMKFKKFSPDLSVFVTDSQQISHFFMVLDAAKHIDSLKDAVEKSVHKYHGRMSLKGQKMSSRLGGVPLAEDLLKIVSRASVERMVVRDVGYIKNGAEFDLSLKEKHKERFYSMKSAIAIGEQIAIAALKFTILKSQAGKNIDFDPETDLSFEGDTGPYIQYTIARSNSVLEKAAEAGIKESFEKNSDNIHDVERLLYRFGEVVEAAAESFEPHHVANYGLQIARAFNSFYGNTKLVDTENPDTGYNLSLVKATSQVLKNVLYLLGIESPDKMEL
jgi:arginyl-tRNA synthetase